MSAKEFIEWLKNYINDDEAEIIFKRWNLGQFDFKKFLQEALNEVKDND